MLNSVKIQRLLEIHEKPRIHINPQVGMVPVNTKLRETWMQVILLKSSVSKYGLCEVSNKE